MITHFRQAIEETLPWLSSFGADPTGGMTRLLYSPEWLETQQQFKKRCCNRCRRIQPPLAFRLVLSVNQTAISHQWIWTSISTVLTIHLSMGMGSDVL